MSDFAEIFHVPARVTARAPGRVNLLGEHTDYNAGYVLPTTIPQTTRVDAALSPDDRSRFYAENLRELVEYENDPEADVAEGYSRYVSGCIEVVKRRGDVVPPVLLHISSEVPMGSGLSSSAALEVAVLRALRELCGFEYDDVELAKLAQQAEIEYAGVRCGILDQMACSLADRDHMLFLDTLTLEQRLLPLPPGDLIVIDSGVPRTLAGSGYNERRAECERAAALLGVETLREVVDPQECQQLPAPLDRRARHVVTENARVLAAVAGVDGPEFGRLMNASHASLRDDYEVSITALDVLVRLLQEHPKVYGARLTGAGFGGACVALAEPGARAEVTAAVLRAYADSGYAGSALV